MNETAYVHDMCGFRQKSYQHSSFLGAGQGRTFTLESANRHIILQNHYWYYICVLSTGCEFT